MTLHLLIIAANKSQRRGPKSQEFCQESAWLPHKKLKGHSSLHICNYICTYLHLWGVWGARRFIGSKHAHEQPSCRLLQGSISLSFFSFFHWGDHRPLSAIPVRRHDSLQLIRVPHVLLHKSRRCEQSPPCLRLDILRAEALAALLLHNIHNAQGR